jgi:hypothetical protein
MTRMTRTIVEHLYIQNTDVCSSLRRGLIKKQNTEQKVAVGLPLCLMRKWGVHAPQGGRGIRGDARIHYRGESDERWRRAAHVEVPRD